MFKKLYKSIAAGLLMSLIGVLVAGQEILAQSGLNSKIINNLTKASGGLQGTDPVAVVSAMVQGALGFLVVIFFVIIIISGFRWMTAGGNEEAIAKAKKNIINAIVGTVIVIMAYAITTFVFNAVLTGTS